MNIFSTDTDVYSCTSMLDDRRLNKMIVETAQILSTALPRLRPDLDTSELYKPTHPNHPCTIWVGDSMANFMWAMDLLDAMLIERCMRYSDNYSSHKSSRILYTLWDLLELNNTEGEVVWSSPPPNCSLGKTKDEYELMLLELEDANVCKLSDRSYSIFNCYRVTMCWKWHKTDKQAPRWTNQDCPDWYRGRREIYRSIAA